MHRLVEEMKTRRSEYQTCYDRLVDMQTAACVNDVPSARFTQLLLCARPAHDCKSACVHGLRETKKELRGHFVSTIRAILIGERSEK